MSKDDVTLTVLMTLSERKVRGNTVKFQVVQWNNGKPTIEAREFWKDDAGNEKTGKAKGLTLEDFDLMLTKAAEIRSKLVTGQNPA